MALFGDIPLPQARDILDQYGRITQTQNEAERGQLANTGLDLANQYQGLLNKFAPEKFRNEARIQEGEISEFPFKNQLRGAQANQANAESRFLPLKYAIEAQNSVRANQRFGQAYQLHQWLSSQSPEAKADWIATHQAEYDQMGADLANGPNLQKQGAILTPEFLSKFGLPGGMGQQGMIGNAPAPAPTPQGAPAGANGLLNNAMTPASGGAPLANAPAFNPTGIPQAPAIPQQAQTQPAPTQNAPFAADTPDQVQHRVLMNQMTANNKAITNTTRNRVEGAIVLEKFAGDNREEYAPKILNAVQYAGALGRGKKFADQLRTEQPQSYADYKWFQNQFKESMVNNVKVMEKLGATDSQRNMMGDMITSIDHVTDTPETTLKLINSSMKLMRDQAKATLDSAQPHYKGVIEKLHNLKDYDGDYVSKEYVDSLRKSTQAPTPEKTTVLDGKTYHMINGQWYPG